MKTNFLKLSVLMAVFMILLSACEKSEPQIESPQPDRKEPFVMTYDDFITPDDVKIISPDYTLISVSSEYAEKMGITDFNDRAVTIWQSISTVPFVRIITDSKVENDRIILTTEKGEFADMFENVEMSLDTDIYVNRDYVRAVGTRSGTRAEVEDVSQKYMDEEGIYHPAVVIFEEDSDVMHAMQTRTGSTKNYFTAEEFLENNFSFNVINVDSDFEIDLTYPLEKDEEDDNDDDEKTDDEASGKVHFQGKVGVEALFSAYANVEVGWFSLKRFESGVKGNTELSAKLAVGIKGKLAKSWEKRIMRIGKVTSVFWVGLVPVPYTIESSIKQKVSAEATGTVDVYASAMYQRGFEKGCLYEPRSGWRDTSKEGTSSKGFSFDGVQGTAEAEANAGIFFEVGIYLAGSAGPKLSVGPNLSAAASVSAAIGGEEINVEGEVGAYAGISGELGCEFKILGYKVAEWSTEFDILKITLFEGSFAWTYTYDSWSQFELGWTSLMNQDSNEWTWGEEPSSVYVPCLTTDSALNF